MNTIFPHNEIQNFNGRIVQREAIADIQIESSYEPLDSQAHPEELSSSKPVILVTPEQYAWLASVRKRTGKTTSCIMRSLIAEQIKREEQFPNT